MYNYRNIVTDSDMLAFGCSHTYGTGVEANETWPYYLNALNFGVPGCSSDLVVRTMPKLLDQYNPKVVFILWPDWTRFEIATGMSYIQSLPTEIEYLYCTNFLLKEMLI